MKKITVIVAAAGMGKRLGLGMNKAFVSIGGKPVLVRCLEMLKKTDVVDAVVVVTTADDIKKTDELIKEYSYLYPDIKISITGGGRERQDSVAAGLACVDSSCSYVAVHDGARPFAGKEVFLRTLAAAERFGAAVPAVPVKDTIKQVKEGGVLVLRSLKRSELVAVQTPQIFKKEILENAYQRLEKQPVFVTDDASLVEAAGGEVAVVDGIYENIKITTPEDLLIAEEIIASEEGACPEERRPLMDFRVGNGFDVHAFAPDRDLIVCGVKIPYEQGLAGHSDADVGLHALSDAILGAAALGDIGKFFPDTDAKFKNIDSRILLREVAEKVVSEGWKINNVDLILMAQAPKMAPYIEEMRKIIAEDLQIAPGRVGVKATTTEKLGFVGRKEGIAAQAVATIIKE